MKTAKMSLMARLKAKKADPKKKPMTVEGAAARPRLDRPGRMKRADGGSTIDRPFLTKEDEQHALMHMVDPTLRRTIEQTPSFQARVAASRMGQAEPGKEDRKRGGKVCK